MRMGLKISMILGFALSSKRLVNENYARIQVLSPSEHSNASHQCLVNTENCM